MEYKQSRPSYAARTCFPGGHCTGAVTAMDVDVGEKVMDYTVLRDRMKQRTTQIRRI